MAAYGLPILYTLLLWWVSTGVILYLDGLHRRTFIWSMAAATGLLGLSLWGAVATASNTTTVGAYLAFACGLACWGWQLVSFYMGYLTGPRKTACPADVSGFERFLAGVGASLYHELAVCLNAAILFALTLSQPNHMAVWTFMVLWWMHQSAKLNVYLGVPNLGEELLPDHLRYLRSFMSRKPMNLLFPVSVTVSTVVTVILAQNAAAPNATPFETAGFTMLATLMALAIAEHWFLVVPLPTNALWQWGVKAAANGDTRVTAEAGVAEDRQERIEEKGALAKPSLVGRETEDPSLDEPRNLRPALEYIGGGASARG
jgi:putative photosynthetic complex assembly protein 2